LDSPCGCLVCDPRSVSQGFFSVFARFHPRFFLDFFSRFLVFLSCDYLGLIPIPSDIFLISVTSPDRSPFPFRHALPGNCYSLGFGGPTIIELFQPADRFLAIRFSSLPRFPVISLHIFFSQNRWHFDAPLACLDLPRVSFFKLTSYIRSRSAHCPPRGTLVCFFASIPPVSVPLCIFLPVINFSFCSDSPFDSIVSRFPVQSLHDCGLHLFVCWWHIVFRRLFPPFPCKIPMGLLFDCSFLFFQCYLC